MTTNVWECRWIKSSAHLDERCLLLVSTVLLHLRVPAAAAVAELLHGLGRGPESHLVTLQVQVAPLPETLLVKVQGWGMQLDRMVSVYSWTRVIRIDIDIYLVEEGIEGPGEEEADPWFMLALMLSSVAMVSLENEFRILWGWKLYFSYYLPKVEHNEHQEVQGLFDECWFVSNTSFFGSWIKY